MSEGWRVKERFLAAREARDPRERADALRSLTTEERAEVESLLRADEAAGDFLSASALELPARIGPYRIIGRLGAGGMGTVYLGASDEDPFQRRVAVKVIAEGALDAEALRRFETERHVLGALGHPNIARLVGSGASGEGAAARPYLALEYVDGLPIDEHCRRRGLSVDERLRLFQSVCAAVHHAHQRRVLHRDLKPANVLVTGDGVPKLLDFGIARPLLTALLPRDRTLTRGGAPCTPEYASPEQVRGEALREPSDVYSLGVLLFRILTDARPYGPGGVSPHEALRLVCEVDVGRPSTCAPPERRAALRGDLDRVVAMATSKDPAARYPSVWALWEDLEAYARGRPLRAHGPSALYRLRKLLARNAGAAAAVGLSALLCAALLLSQAREARRHRQDLARQAEEVRRLREALGQAGEAPPAAAPSRAPDAPSPSLMAATAPVAPPGAVATHTTDVPSPWPSPLAAGADSPPIAATAPPAAAAPLAEPSAVVMTRPPAVERAASPVRRARPRSLAPSLQGAAAAPASVPQGEPLEPRGQPLERLLDFIQTQGAAPVIMQSPRGMIPVSPALVEPAGRLMFVAESPGGLVPYMPEAGRPAQMVAPLVVRAEAGFYIPTKPMVVRILQ